jgi:hypothetical protein
MAEEKDWADEYDPTNPDGPEPKNMQKTDPIGDLIEKHGMPAGPAYDPLRTNLGPVGFVKAAPQVDPMPMEIPPNMNPNMEIRNNEGPFFSSSNRRGGQSWATRSIEDYLQNMMTPADSKVGSPWRSIDMNQWAGNTGHMPNDVLREGHMADAHYFPAPPMGKDVGTDDLDRYNRTYRMPNFPRDARLAKDNDAYDDALTLRTMPEYMQKDAAEQLAKDAMDSKMESETVWEGKSAPTQADIDKVKANPTDGLIQMFEDQFGAEAVSKVFPDEEEPVPLPKPRPKSAPKRK